MRVRSRARATRRRGFTLIELLVAVAIMSALTLMAQATYVIYMRDTVQATLKQNLFQLRHAFQNFYADHGRYPYDQRDGFGNPIGILDSETSELTQGVRSAGGTFPAQRVRYLMEIPIDPTANQANWRIIPFDNDADWQRFSDVGDPGVPNDFGAGEGNGFWDGPTSLEAGSLNHDTGDPTDATPPRFGEGDGRPTRGETNVDEDGFTGGGTDPPDGQDVVSFNPDWEHL